MLEIFDDVEQRSDRWWELRRGLPTASSFSTILAKGRDGGKSKVRHTYLTKLAGEVLTGQQVESYTNHHLERGREMEAEARNFYAFMKDAEPELVGFIRNGPVGCSPDALLGDDGVLEIKTALPHILIDLILKDRFPPEHKAQCQGQLWVSERQWCDLVVYYPNMPLFVKRAERDEDYIKTLASEVERFNAELAEMVEKIRAYNAPSGVGHVGPSERGPAPESDDVVLMP